MKKIITGLSILGLAVCCLAGCGKKGQETADIQKVTKDYVYRMELMEAADDDVSLLGPVRIGEQVYAYAYQWVVMDESQEEHERTEEDLANAEIESDVEDRTEDLAETEELPMEEERIETYEYQTICFYEVREDGTFGQQHVWKAGVEEYFTTFVADRQGNLYTVRNVYHYDEDTGESQDEYYLEQMTLDGEVLHSTVLNELSEVQKITEEQGWFGVTNLFAEDDVLYLQTSFGDVLAFDKECQFDSVAMQGDNTEVLEGAIYVTADHQYAAVSYGEEQVKITKVDLATGTVGESYDIPGDSYGYSFYTGDQYDFYVTDNYAVYGYNLGDAALTKLLSYVDSDLDVWEISNILSISETEFYGHCSGRDSGIAKFTKVNPADIEDKQVLTLAMAGMNWDLKSRVIQFNKSSKEYRISLVDYTAESGDYDTVLSRMNTDIVSGNIPDILLLDESLPVDSYISKGLLADLLPFIEKDEEIDRNDLMPNIVEAFSTDGKMYQLVPSYSIRTLVAKTSDVGEESGWTIDEALELWNSKPEGTEFIAGMTRNEMLETFMLLAGNQFVDYESGKCNFDQEEFVQFLEFLSRFPTELPDDYYSDEYWNQYDSMWRRGVALTRVLYWGDFRSITYEEQGTFGEPITFIGMPSTDGCGTVIMPYEQFAISSKSNNQEAAWEFLRYYLSEEYQSEVGGFPISMKEMEKRAKEATQRPSYKDENGDLIEYDDSTWIGDVEILITPMTQEEADGYVEMLKSFTHVGKYDRTLLNMITEEASPFFEGQKSAAEVAKIVQNRAQIYLQEMQ